MLANYARKLVRWRARRESGGECTHIHLLVPKLFPSKKKKKVHESLIEGAIKRFLLRGRQRFACLFCLPRCLSWEFLPSIRLGCEEPRHGKWHLSSIWNIGNGHVTAWSILFPYWRREVNRGTSRGHIFVFLLVPSCWQGSSAQWPCAHSCDDYLALPSMNVYFYSSVWYKILLKFWFSVRVHYFSGVLFHSNM